MPRLEVAHLLLLGTSGRLGVIVDVLHITRHLVETNLLGDALTAALVLGTRLVTKDLVDVLKGLALEFGENEDRVEETDDTEAHENDVRLPTNRVEHDRRDHGNGKVHDPVRGRRDRHALGTHVNWKS